MTTPGKHLNWIDLETTGLDENEAHAKILECALVITDPDLNEVKRLSLVAHEPLGNDELSLWPSRVFQMHSKSGLIDDCQDPERSVPIAELDLQMSNLIRSTSKGGKLSGNSVGTFDRRWLKKFMPLTFKMLHGYQVYDMRTLMICVESWVPDGPQYVKEIYSTYSHRALDDILCSIDMARFTRGLMEI